MGKYEDIIKRYAEQYVENLKRVTPKDTGKTASEITYRLIPDGFEVISPDYLEYLDKGVNGVKNKYGSIYSYTNKKPPISQIEGFAQRKNINVYALQNSIYNKGIKPKNFITKADTEVDLEILADTFIEDLQDNLKEI